MFNAGIKINAVLERNVRSPLWALSRSLAFLSFKQEHDKDSIIPYLYHSQSSDFYLEKRSTEQNV